MSSIHSSLNHTRSCGQMETILTSLGTWALWSLHWHHSHRPMSIFGCFVCKKLTPHPTFRNRSMWCCYSVPFNWRTLKKYFRTCLASMTRHLCLDTSVLKPFFGSVCIIVLPSAHIIERVALFKPHHVQNFIMTFNSAMSSFLLINLINN